MYLDVRNNNFASQGLQALVSALKVAKSIETLLIENVTIDEESVASLEKFFSEKECSVTKVTLNLMIASK